MNRSTSGFLKCICILCLVSGFPPSLAAQHVRVEQVRIPGPEVTLAGSLYLPESCASNCPAMVFLGGGSADTRKNQIPFAERFARSGIISLIFDKRGAGESTGDYAARTYDNLADDAVLALQYLAERAETDASKTGIWGGSEGGSVALMTAARTSDAAFVINLAGPVQHFREGFLYELNLSLQKAGINERQRKELQALWMQYFEDAGDGRIESALLDKIRLWKDIVAANYIPSDTAAYPPESNSHPRSFWHLHRLSIFKYLDMPVFMIFGEYDEPVPPEQNIPIVKSAFSVLGQSNYEIHVFPQASHAFVTPEGNIVPRFFETQIDWVLRQAGELK